MTLREVGGANHHHGGLVLVIVVLTGSTVRVLLLSSLSMVGSWQVATYLRFILLGSGKQEEKVLHPKS